MKEGNVTQLFVASDAMTWLALFERLLLKALLSKPRHRVLDYSELDTIKVQRERVFVSAQLIQPYYFLVNR